MIKQDFDFNAFLRRKNLKHREAAELIGVSQGLVSSWAARRAVPSYESLALLINAGIRAEELLGVPLANKLNENSGVEDPKTPPTNEELKSAVRDVIADLFANSGSQGK